MKIDSMGHVFLAIYSTIFDYLVRVYSTNILHYIRLFFGNIHHYIRLFSAGIFKFRVRREYSRSFEKFNNNFAKKIRIIIPYNLF